MKKIILVGGVGVIALIGIVTMQLKVEGLKVAEMEPNGVRPMN